MRLYGILASGAAAMTLLAGCGGKDTATTQQAANDAAQTLAEDAAAVAASLDAEITAEDLARHISTLASDEYEGRAPTTAGGEKTRNYIAAEYKRLGFEPVNGAYFQQAPMVESLVDPEKSSLVINVNGAERPLAYKTDAVWGTKQVQPEVKFENSDMVFVGYGIVAPEYGWNDYAGIDPKGKTVVMLINDPGFATQDPDLFNGNAMTYYGRWTYKYEEAARQGAAAAIIIHDTAPAAYGWNVVEGSWSGPQIDLQRSDDGMSRAKMEAWITNDVARELMIAAGLDLDALQDAAKTPGFTPVAMTGLTASGDIVQTLKRSEDANVVGVLPGTEAPDEYVLYMGHWDHLGVNPTAEGDDKIYNGAVDNATGVAAILEIGEKFAAGERPRRSILLAAVTAEESGLLGSAYFAENPPVPLKNIVGGINIDAMMPTPPAKDIVVVGYGASELEDLLKTAADAEGRYLKADPEPEKGYFYRSDHISLAKKGVPMLYADGGFDLVDGGEAAGEAFGADYTANRYHQPSDEYSEDWDLTGMVEMVDILYEVGEEMADSDIWPNWYDGNEFRSLRDAQRAEE